MSNLKDKSELSYAAAGLLDKNSYYSSVVHCAYYSCVQLMKHILIFTLDKSEISMESERKGQGVHAYLINEIAIELRDNKKDWKAFNSNVLQLKKLRGIADYENIVIDSSKGKESIQLADKVLKQLKSSLKI